MRTGITALLCIIIALAMTVQADIRTVPPAGTVFIGEEHLDISGSGLSPGSQIAWWAPGTSLVETPADTVTVTNPSSFSALSSSFAGKEGIWYSLGEKTPIFKIKSPRLRLKISDTTSDFDATGKWLPRGHLASFQIESNLYELRSRTGVTGAPVDIIIKTPEGGEYSAVSGPSGSFSLTGIPVSSASYDTGPVWNTGNTDSGTYTIRAECTANEMKSNSVDPGTGVSVPITVLIQDINPLSEGGRQVEIQAGQNFKTDTQGITDLQTGQKIPGPTMTSGKITPVSTPTDGTVRTVITLAPTTVSSPEITVTQSPARTPLAQVSSETPTTLVTLAKTPTTSAVPSNTTSAPSPTSTVASLPTLQVIIAVLAGVCLAGRP
ncbi:MAG: DUF3821 domain-containing protein [Methanospirillum sp.]|uniref:DUF3821 domain-containing protein n=1 Tax=Methanospirillum sp. TaxID=45200 RepID=UPI0023728A05|nr:DUF3821 domain-containing protein [Methanospirillum sp.]MDD1729227.1 DUF3821 domain-containing protein [Methanospirillum sp.]